MTNWLVKIFLAALTFFATQTFASVDIPSEDSYSDLTKAVLDENPTPEAHLLEDVEDNDQSAVKSEYPYTDIYGQRQPEQLNQQLSVIDVVLRKRHTEAPKSEEKVFDIPHVDKLPIREDVPHNVASDSPSSIQQDKIENNSTEGGVGLTPITFKLTSSSNHDDNKAKDKQLDVDKEKEESVKIIVSPLERVPA